MFDDIVKALTIQIKADDLTGGAWSKIGDGVKTVWNNVAALNQAWELGGKVFDKVSGILSTGVDALSRGGAFAETEAAFRNLSQSMRVDGDSIVGSLLNISSNTENLERVTQSASNAMRQGYSAEQAQIIAGYAKKYTEAVGGNFLEVNDKIVDAIAQGKTKVLKEFGIMAEAGDKVSVVLGKMQKNAESFGRGAFNFGDDWSSMFISLENALLRVEKEMNVLAGVEGFGDFAASLRNAFAEISKDAPTLALAIFKPISDIGVAALKTLAVPLDILWDLLFDNTDSLHTQILTLAKFTGNTIYDLARIAGVAWDGVMAFVNANLINLLDVLAGFDLQMEKSLGVSVFGKEWRASMTGMIDSINKTSSVYEELTFKQTKFNNDLDFMADKAAKASAENNRFTDGLGKVSTGLLTVGQGFEKEKKAKDDSKKATKELSDETKELAKTYTDLGKGLEGTVKTMGDVVNKTQEGINKTAEQQVDFLSTADMFTFGAGQKKDAIEKVMTGLQGQKAEEMRVLEKSADAQIELARAYTQFANTPRKIEHMATGSAKEILMSLVMSVIESLNNLSLTENTPVAGVS